jgi:hypothetical protein
MQIGNKVPDGMQQDRIKQSIGHSDGTCFLRQINNRL